MIILESIWCIVTVDDWGILDITQQLASTPIGCASNPNNNVNPFSRSIHFGASTENNNEVSNSSLFTVLCFQIIIFSLSE